METVKEKGLFRKFIEWLGKVDEDTIDDKGDINEKAFEGEDPKVIAELKRQSKKVDNIGSTMFIDRAKQREQTVKGLKAKIEQPAKVEQKQEENDIEQEKE